MSVSCTIPADLVSVEVADSKTEIGILAYLRVPAAGSEQVTGRISRVQNGFYQLTASKAFAQGAKVEVAIEDCSFHCEVLSCQSTDSDEFSLSLVRVYGPEGAKRAEPRIPVDVSAIIRTPCSEGEFARIVDMSQSGMGLELSAPLEVGTRVSLSFDSGIAFGEIKHCAPAKSVFRAGVRIDEVIVRPRNTETPQSKPLPIRSGQRSNSHRSVQRALLFGSRCVCFLAGHDYEWSLDLWKRSVLTCARCKKLLDPWF